MRVSSMEIPDGQERSRAVLWVLLAFFAVGVVLPNFPQVFPRPVMAGAQAIPAALFALIHGANAYRLRGILGFVIISLIVGYAAEALGVHTGFPFGHYYFTDGMGPKLFDVPILMGPAYVGMGYVSWTVARVIAAPESGKKEMGGLRLIALPLAASFVMVAWDIAIDPVLSTFSRYWVWTRGGSFFGVPVSNFLGWYATNYLIYQLFAFYQRRKLGTFNSSRLSHAGLAVAFYTVCAAGIVLRSALAPASSTLVDPAGVTWRVRDINAASSLAGIFIMGAFASLAVVRLVDRGSDASALTYGPREDADKAGMTFTPQDEIEQAK